jgi:ammonium transporter, Amt family
MGPTLIRGRAAKGILGASLTALLWAWAVSAALAQPAEPIPGPIDASGGAYPVDLVWLVFAAVLVLFMQAGFAMVEAGFTRAKNAVNILMKNLMDVSLGSLAFWALGFGLMFGVTNGIAGTSGFFLDGLEDPAQFAFVLFQTAFAGGR